MSLAPFPSRRIAIYTAKMFLVRTFAVLLMLVLVLQTLDLLGESGKILAYPGNGEPELWRYVGYRLPQLISRFLPFSVLLGTLITLVTLNQNSEIVILKAAGISAHQILAPLMIASLGIAALSFTFNERVLTRANRALDSWQNVDYGKVPPGSDTLPDVWVRYEDDLIHATTVTGHGQQTRLSGVTVYQRDGGRLDAIVSAASARPEGDGWRIEKVSRFVVATGRTETTPMMHTASGIGPDRFTLSDVDADQLSFPELYRAIGNLEAAGRPTGPLRAALYHKISGPLAAVLMPLLGAVAGFGLARSGRLFIRTVIGMGLGFAYFVGDNFALAMGNFGAVPPILAAWAPFLLFYLIGESVLFRTEE